MPFVPLSGGLGALEFPLRFSQNSFSWKGELKGARSEPEGQANSLRSIGAQLKSHLGHDLGLRSRVSSQHEFSSMALKMSALPELPGTCNGAVFEAYSCKRLARNSVHKYRLYYIYIYIYIIYHISIK